MHAEKSDFKLLEPKRYSLGTRLITSSVWGWAHTTFTWILSYCTGSNWGIPNQLMRRNNRIARIDPSLLTSYDAVQLYEQFGGNITQFSAFGQDPLNSRSDLVQQRETEFYQRYPQFGPFFHKLVNVDACLFREGLLYFILAHTWFPWYDTLNNIYKRCEQMIIIIYYRVTAGSSSLSRSSWVWMTFCTSVMKSSNPLSNMVSLHPLSARHDGHVLMSAWATHLATHFSQPTTVL